MKKILLLIITFLFSINSFSAIEIRRLKKDDLICKLNKIKKNDKIKLGEKEFLITEFEELGDKKSFERKMTGYNINNKNEKIEYKMWFFDRFLDFQLSIENEEIGFSFSTTPESFSLTLVNYSVNDTSFLDNRFYKFYNLNNISKRIENGMLETIYFSDLKETNPEED